ncbi:MAG: DUF6179 domain-containing protein [Hespellia sp.]|nr:DUF6179 domain-containing protein [Hespellia sp.]
MKRSRMEEVVELVAKLAASYTGLEHSSVTYETAQMLMGAVLYCIQEYEGQQKEGMLEGDSTPASQAYQMGYEKVLEKTIRLKTLYHDMISEFQDYGMKCLSEVIMQGIPAFLVNYDAKYMPQDTILTLDYPILESMKGISGVDAVFRYMQCICLEQKFLAVFEGTYVTDVLRVFHEDYEDLFENICEIVLQNMYGHLILQKPFAKLEISREEHEEIEKTVAEKTVDELEADVDQMIMTVVERYFKNDVQLYQYLSKDSRNIAVRVKHWVYVKN